MLAKLRPRSVYDVMAAIACFGVLAGGTAYAANEWNSSNIQNETLLGADVRGTDGTSTTKGINGGLSGADISGQKAIPATGQPFVNGSLGTYDIADNSLTGDDVNADSLKGADIEDFSLNDEDISQQTPSVNFEAPIGVVPAQSCKYLEITGINAQGDHLLLTPNFLTTATHLSYGIEYDPNLTSAELKTCNPTSGNIDNGHTRFNLIVIDAQ